MLHSLNQTTGLLDSSSWIKQFILFRLDQTIRKPVDERITLQGVAVYSSAHILARRSELFRFAIFRDGGPECICDTLCKDLI
jgi:hypothetical protein